MDAPPSLRVKLTLSSSSSSVLLFFFLVIMQYLRPLGLLLVSVRIRSPRMDEMLLFPFIGVIAAIAAGDLAVASFRRFFSGL